MKVAFTLGCLAIVLASCYARPVTTTPRQETTPKVRFTAPAGAATEADASAYPIARRVYVVWPKLDVPVVVQVYHRGKMILEQSVAAGASGSEALLLPANAVCEIKAWRAGAATQDAALWVQVRE